MKKAADYSLQVMDRYYIREDNKAVYWFTVKEGLANKKEYSVTILNQPTPFQDYIPEYKLHHFEDIGGTVILRIDDKSYEVIQPTEDMGQFDFQVRDSDGDTLLFRAKY
jgi:hypothetical protein